MHHGVRRRFFGGVGILFRALAVGKVPAGLIVNNITRGIHRAALICGGRLAVHGDAAVAENDLHRRHLHRHIAAKQHRRHQKHCHNFGKFHITTPLRPS